MSKSYRKNPVRTEASFRSRQGKWWKQKYNRAIRRNHKDIPDGNRYKHLYNSWNISDYAFRMTWEDYQRRFDWMYADKATMWADWKKMYRSK